MSTRERWIVYPLLFMTLGIALKDKIVRRLSTDQVECRALIVTDGRGHERVIVGSNSDGGLVHTRSARNGVDVSVGHFDVYQRAGLLITPTNSSVPLRGSILIPSVLPRRGEQPRAGNERPAAEKPDAQDHPPFESNDSEPPSDP